MVGPARHSQGGSHRGAEPSAGPRGVGAAGPDTRDSRFVRLELQGSCDDLRAYDDATLCRSLSRALTQVGLFFLALSAPSPFSDCRPLGQAFFLNRVAGERLRQRAGLLDRSAREAEGLHKAAEEARGALGACRAEAEMKLRSATRGLEEANERLEDRVRVLTAAVAQSEGRAVQLEEALRSQEGKEEQLREMLAEARSGEAGAVEEGNQLREDNFYLRTVISGLRLELGEARGAEAEAREAEAEARAAEATAVDFYRRSDECSREKVAFAAPLYSQAGRDAYRRVSQEYPDLDFSFLEDEGYFVAAPLPGTAAAKALIAGAPVDAAPAGESTSEGPPVVAAPGVLRAGVVPGEAPVVAVSSDADPTGDALGEEVSWSDSGASLGADPVEVPSPIPGRLD